MPVNVTFSGKFRLDKLFGVNDGFDLIMKRFNSYFRESGMEKFRQLIWKYTQLELRVSLYGIRAIVIA